MSDSKDKITAKIRALLAKTVENGATEAEAIAASDMAARLMQQYDLAHVDVEAEVQAERYGARHRTPGGNHRKRPHEAILCAKAIGDFWDCKVWSRNKSSVVFFGSVTDTEFAHDMLDMIVAAMEAEWAGYYRNYAGAGNGRSMRASFMAGMGTRIAERLREMKAARSAADKAHRGSTALVVVKGAVVTDKFAAYCRQNNMNLSRRYSNRTVRDTHAFGAGKAAGGRVDLGGAKVAGSGQTRIGG